MSLAYNFDYDPQEKKYSPVSGTISFDYRQYGTTSTAFSGSVAATVTKDKFSEFELYDVPNWDGYNANPITAVTVSTARQFQSLLDRSHAAHAEIAPGGDGTIGFEWQFGAVLVCVDIGPGNVVKGRKVHADGTIEARPETQIGDGAYHLIR